MKVKEFLDRYSMASNAVVTVLDARNEKEWRMFYDQMRRNQYFKWEGETKYDIGSLKLNTFSVRDNKLTIYAE